LPSKTIKDARLLGLWFFHISSPIKPISRQEIQLANQLPPKRKKEYSQARGYARYALSTLFGVNPLEIPLNSLPGKPPKLPEEWGSISISHCKDAFLIGWSSQAIGVDIERTDRIVNTNRFTKRFLNAQEQESVRDEDKNYIQRKKLEYWLIKEAAIKLQKGNLFNDFHQWSISEDSQTALHKILGYTINYNLMEFKSWSIGIASNRNIDLSNPILCIN
tara:strand:+ start:359 stop:1015 length:657 start_codon:yes stop_codon:yes gene_type:complete